MSARGNRSLEKDLREGSIFILQHHSYLSCRLGMRVFCPYSNGPDVSELKAEMKSSLMAL